MVRLLRLTTHALIALAAIEGSVAHLAHTHHRHHGGEQDAGGCSHVHASVAADEPTLAVSAVVPAEGSCLACVYLSQRAGLDPVTDEFESCEAVDSTRAIWSRVDLAGARGGHSARAPPVLG